MGNKREFWKESNTECSPGRIVISKAIPFATRIRGFEFALWMNLLSLNSCGKQTKEKRISRNLDFVQLRGNDFKIQKWRVTRVKTECRGFQRTLWEVMEEWIKFELKIREYWTNSGKECRGLAIEYMGKRKAWELNLKFQKIVEMKRKECRGMGMEKHGIKNWDVIHNIIQWIHMWTNEAKKPKRNVRDSVLKIIWKATNP